MFHRGMIAIISKSGGYRDRLESQNFGNQTEGLFDYIQEEALDYYVSFYNQWISNKNETMGFLVVRYEDLRKNTFAELKRVMNFIGLAIPDEILRDAIEYASFRNMRKMEFKRESRMKTLKPGNSQNVESYKTRKGKIGGFKEYLSMAEIALIEKEVNERLNPFLGYNYYSNNL